MFLPKKLKQAREHLLVDQQNSNDDQLLISPNKELSGSAGAFEGGECQTSADDDLEKSHKDESLEKYLDKLLNKSPNRKESLDLFLMLDQENDQYLKLIEIQPIWEVLKNMTPEDQGKITSEEALKEEFENFGLYQVDKHKFNEFVDATNFNCTKVRDVFYQRNYDGCCAKICCLCCRCCSQAIRNRMVQKELDKEDESQRKLVYNEKAKHSSLEDIVAVGMAILQAYSEVLHHVTDIVLCYTVYWTGMEQQTPSYKLATVWIFMSISSVYLIAYSSMINMFLFKGIYEPQQIRKNSCCQVFIKLVFLSFLGPLYFILVELISKAMTLCASFGMLFCGKPGFQAVRVRFLRILGYGFQLNEEQIQGLTKQRGVVTLLFESIPMVILQLLIRKGVIQCETLLEESSNTLLLSLILCFVNVFVIMLMIYMESKAFTEPVLDFILNSFKARQGWVPFMHQIKNKELKQAVDYAMVQCSYPLITGTTGIYKSLNFQFSDISLQALTSALVKWHSTTTEELADEVDSDDEEDTGQYQRQRGNLLKNKYIIDIGGSLSFVSVNMFLHFYHLAPKERIHTKLSNLNLDQLIANAKGANLLYQSKDGALSEARTPSGLHLLWICMEDEKVSNPTSKELYETSLGLSRRLKLARSILKMLYNYNYQSYNFKKKIKKFDRSIESGGIAQIDIMIEHLLWIQSTTIMKEAQRLIKKANSIMNEVEEFVICMENDLFGTSLITSIKDNLYLEKDDENILSNVRNSTRGIELAFKMLNEKLQGIDLDEYQEFEGIQREIQKLKEDGSEKMEAAFDDYYKSMLERVAQDTSNPYLLLDIGKEYRQKYNELKAEIRYREEQAQLANQFALKVVAQKGEKFEYTPQEDDDIDKKFAEAYKQFGNHRPVKRLPDDEYSQDTRFYEYGGIDIQMNMYENYRRRKQYTLYTQSKFYISQEDWEEEFFRQFDANMFEEEQAAYGKDEINLVDGRSPEEQEKIDEKLIKNYEDRIKDALEKKIGQLDKSYYQKLISKSGCLELEKVYKQIETVLPKLPPLEEMQVHYVKDCPNFTSPDGWMLSECFEKLFYQEKCNPNIKDNNGETLLNATIAKFKKQSLKMLLENEFIKINEPNDRGITPLGQAFISRNIYAIEELVKLKADIHATCVLDQKISRKMLTPLHYFVKRIRCQGAAIDDNDKIIMDLLVKYNIKAENEAEKIGLLRQLCRMWSTKDQTCPHQIATTFLVPLLHEKDLDLLNFRDIKGNSAFHLATKTRQETTYEFLKEKIYDYIPGSNEEGQKRVSLQNLLKSKNIKDKQDPLEMAFLSCDHKNIVDLCRLFVDNFDRNQEEFCIYYFYVSAAVDYGAYTYRGMSYRSKTDPLLEYFKDIEKMKTDLKNLVDKEKPSSLKFILINLYQTFGIGKAINDRGQQATESSVYKRDQSKERLVVTICKLEDVEPGEKKPKGQYMRIVKGKGGMMGALQASMLKSFYSGSQKFDKVKEVEKEAALNPHFEFVFTLILELIALFDMVGDIYLLQGLYGQGHIAWASLSIFTMLSPFYVCYVPLVTFQKKRSQLQEDTKFLKVLNVLSMTPLIVVYLLLMDLVYIVTSVIITPFAMLLKLISCGCIDITNVEEKLDGLYNILFGMTDMDIKGFRRLRTISQLSFESLPQILLQIRILIYAYGGEEDTLGVNLNAIIASLVCAILHAFFELNFVYLEAVSCKTTVIHYFIVCFNARFGWIPFVNFFSSLAGFDEDSKDNQENLNYEGMKSQLCGLKFQMHFKFSNSSCETLINSLSNLRNEDDPNKRMTLKIGESLNEVDFPLILDLMIISNNRINLDLSEVAILDTLNRNQNTIKELTTEKTDEEKDNEYLIQRVAKLGQSSIVKEMFKIEGLYMDISPNLLEIATEMKDYDLMKLVFNKEGFEEKLRSVKNNVCFMETLITENPQPVVLKGLFSNPNIIIPEFYQMHIFNHIVVRLISKEYDEYLELYQWVFGSCLPLYLLRGFGDNHPLRSVNLQKLRDRYETTKEVINDFRKKFPEKIYFFCSNPKEEEQPDSIQLYSIKTEIASYFSVLRDKIIRHWNLMEELGNHLGSEANPFDAEPLNIDIHSLLTVEKLLTKDHTMISLLDQEEVSKCDDVVKKLCLDKYRATYFHRSRENDQTLTTYRIKCEQEEKLSLNDENQARKQGFKERVVLFKERWFGAYCCSFNYTLPKEVLAIKKVHLQYEYYGATMLMHHCSKWHQSVIEVSNHPGNVWDNLAYNEEFQEDEKEMQGFKDLITTVTGGDTIQLWLMTDGYAFSKGVLCQLDVICDVGQELELTSTAPATEKTE